MIMGINVKTIDSYYNFEIVGASYIGNPQDNTVMYVSKKAEALIYTLECSSCCLIFTEKGIDIPEHLRLKNCFVMTDNPQHDYADFVKKIAREIEREERRKKYTLTEGGYYIGEDVKLGYNVYIEPGCLIGHDVVIGDNGVILSGSVIKNAIIGINFLCNENSVIGANGFTMAKDDSGNLSRIPSLGKVIIGDNVEIGSHNNISRGSAGNTVIEDNVKIDTLTHIGHDAYLAKNTEIVACALVGGFVETGENAYIGLNSTIRNRIRIGENAFVGMGAVVLKSVPDGVTVVGNPAREYKKIFS